MSQGSDDIAYIGSSRNVSRAMPIVIDSESEADEEIGELDIINQPGPSRLPRLPAQPPRLDDIPIDYLRSSPSPSPEPVRDPSPKAKKRASAADDAEAKARKKLDREAAKAAKEAEKSYQKKLTEVNKLRTSKNEAIREIHLYLSSELELPSSPIAGALPEIRTRIADNLSNMSFVDYPIPRAVRYKRHVTSRWDAAQKRFCPLDDPQWVWESTFAIIITAEELVDYIASDSLMEWVKDVRAILGEGQMILIIKGLGKYHSKTKTLANKEYTTAARTGASLNTSTARVDKAQVDMEMVKLQVAQNCFLVKGEQCATPLTAVEKTEDIEDWIYNLAADIAIRPYKLLSKSHLSFCPTDGVKKSSVPRDALELMLQEVQGITPSAAAGIAAEHPSFADLMEAFERAERRGNAETLLENCEIRNLRNGTASGRRLNKALAKRVHAAMRGEDSLALA